jgi:hypothetical protein
MFKAASSDTTLCPCPRKIWASQYENEDHAFKQNGHHRIGAAGSARSIAKYRMFARGGQMRETRCTLMARDLAMGIARQKLSAVTLRGQCRNAGTLQQP